MTSSEPPPWRSPRDRRDRRRRVARLGLGARRGARSRRGGAGPRSRGARQRDRGARRRVRRRRPRRDGRRRRLAPLGAPAGRRARRRRRAGCLARRGGGACRGRGDARRRRGSGPCDAHRRLRVAGDRPRASPVEAGRADRPRGRRFRPSRARHCWPRVPIAAVGLAIAALTLGVGMARAARGAARSRPRPRRGRARRSGPSPSGTSSPGTGSHSPGRPSRRCSRSSRTGSATRACSSRRSRTSRSRRSTGSRSPSDRGAVPDLGDVSTALRTLHSPRAGHLGPALRRGTYRLGGRGRCARIPRLLPLRRCSSARARVVETLLAGAAALGVVAFGVFAVSLDADAGHVALERRRRGRRPHGHRGRSTAAGERPPRLSARRGVSSQAGVCDLERAPGGTTWALGGRGLLRARSSRAEADQYATASRRAAARPPGARSAASSSSARRPRARVPISGGQIATTPGRSRLPRRRGLGAPRAPFRNLATTLWSLGLVALLVAELALTDGGSLLAVAVAATAAAAAVIAQRLREPRLWIAAASLLAADALGVVGGLTPPEHLLTANSNPAAGVVPLVAVAAATAGARPHRVEPSWLDPRRRRAASRSTQPR